MEKERLYLDFGVDIPTKDGKVEADQGIFDKFLEAYAKAFAKKKSWYRIGSSSGKVIIEGIMAGEFIEFILNIKELKALEENILQINPFLRQQGTSTLGRMALFSLDRYIFSEYRAVMERKMYKAKGVTPDAPKRTIETKTYNYEGEEVVFLSFFQACYNETDYYAVPVDVAIELSLEDYDGEEISRDEDFLDDIGKYEITEDFMFKGSCIKTYNYD